MAIAQDLTPLYVCEKPMQGGRYTWGGGLHNSITSQLHSYVMMPGMKAGGGVGSLYRFCPDHIFDCSPVMLETDSVSNGTIPFRFES